MKKISIALGILVAISVGAWVYLATKFERIAKEEILPQIKNSEYLIDADIESAIIEKFKFQVTLKDVIIFPKSKALMVFSDEVIACYNPLNDKIIAKFKSDKFKGGSGKTEIYFTASDKKIEFNRAFLNNKFENANIVISSGEINTYFANDNSEISHLDKSTISLISKLDKEGFYNIDLKLNIEGIESNPESKYFKYMFEELVPNLAQQQPVDKRFEKIEEYYGKILSKLGPVNYNSESSLKLEKKHVENIFAALNGELEPIEIYQNFSFTSDNYLLSIKETSGNSYTSDSFNYKLVGDGSTITSDLNLVLTKNYNDIQRKDIAVLILELFNSINPQATPVSQNDLSVLLEKYLDTKQINFSFNVNYDIASRSGKHSSECKIDNLTFNAEGALKEQKYDGNLKLVTPKILVYGISGLYNGGIKFLMQRNGLDTTNSDIVVENIKTNGIEFLSAFDKKNSLKEDDSFESNITFNLENFEFKVNNKGILDLLTEERVVKFLKGMPHAEESPQ